jgi:hypothetical protein
MRPNLPGKSNCAGKIKGKSKGKIKTGVLEFWSVGVMMKLNDRNPTF